MSDRERVVCRMCGAWVYETDDDPCPGLCPPCMRRAMMETLFATWQERWAGGATVRRSIDRNCARLEALGLTPEAVGRWRRGAESALAAELAAERRGN